MKVFLDTANLMSIEKWSKSGLIDGVTTNPTLLSKEHGVPTEVIKQICALVPNGDISVEVTEQNSADVYAQAKRIAKLAKNVVVKIPCHPDYIEIIKQLVKDNVQLNITLLFGAFQAIAMAKLGVKYISPFIGRLDDIDCDGMQLVRDLRMIFDGYDFETQILAASIRNVTHVHEAALAGADVITLGVETFEKALHHPLTDAGMKRFDEDWKRLGIKQFP